MKYQKELFFLLILIVSTILYLYGIDQNYIVGGLLVLCLIIYLYRNQFEGYESSCQSPNPKIKGFDQMTPTTGRFTNFNLTVKPRPNNGPYPAYIFMRDGFNPLQNRQYQICNQYRCQTAKCNGLTAKPHFNLKGGCYQDPTMNSQSVDGLGFGYDWQYYEDPINFCQNNPQYQLCPNHWITECHPPNASQPLPPTDC